MALPHATDGIVPYIPSEIDDYEEMLARHDAGQISEEEFRGDRLRRGVYGQRQPARQMFRIKIPMGVLSAAQLDVLGQIVTRHAPTGKGHFTTRENLQLHHIDMSDTPAMMRALGTVGLTTREACGNTVRNVVGCPLAGTCPDEAFDATAYGAAFARFFVRQDLTQNLPRKFKVAFTGCREDHAITRMHDMGFAGLVRADGVRGFRIVVGGGTSIEPLLAKVLYDFVTADDGAYLRVAEAVLRVFNRSDELRRNRMKARIKILVNRIGIDAFRALVDAELQEPWAQKPVDHASLIETLPELDDAPVHPPAPPAGSREPAFAEWMATNAVQQRQRGYYAVWVTLPLGDVSAQQFPLLADMARRYSNGSVRTTQDQNLVFRWIPGNLLHEVWTHLAAMELGAAGARGITDIVACPGTDSCKLGITASMGLGRAVRQSLVDTPALTADPLIKGLHVKISGCPNGCGQHHIADIGFHGAAVRGDGGQQVPAYEIFLGGRYDDGDVRYGARLRAKVPAKTVPAVVHEFLMHYQRERRGEEAFHAFVDRQGREPFERIAQELGVIPALADEPAECYTDWDREIKYRVERGEGECAV